jgi:hypothetical protein
MDANDYHRLSYEEYEAKRDKEWEEYKSWKLPYLMDDKCDPFKPENVQEAICQASLADAILLASYVQSAKNLPDNMSAKIYLSDFMIRMVTEYWEGVADFIALDKFEGGER